MVIISTGQYSGRHLDQGSGRVAPDSAAIGLRLLARGIVVASSRLRIRPLDYCRRSTGSVSVSHNQAGLSSCLACCRKLHVGNHATVAAQATEQPIRGSLRDRHDVLFAGGALSMLLLAVESCLIVQDLSDLDNARDTGLRHAVHLCGVDMSIRRSFAHSFTGANGKCI